MKRFALSTLVVDNSDFVLQNPGLTERKFNPELIMLMMKKIIDRLHSFEEWFNASCGWFFTNGMKIYD